MDVAARISFPSVYVVFFVLMVTPGETDNKLILAHMLVGAFWLLGGAYCWFEAAFFPLNVVRRAVRRKTTASLRHKTWKFSDIELHQVFDRLHALDKSEHRDVVKIEQMVDWLIFAKRGLKGHKEEVYHLVEITFGEEEFQFPIFKQEFATFLTKLTLLLHDDHEQKSAVEAQRQDRKARTNSKPILIPELIAEGEEPMQVVVDDEEEEYLEVPELPQKPIQPKQAPRRCLAEELDESWVRQKPSDTMMVRSIPSETRLAATMMDGSTKAQPSTGKLIRTI